jgi:hypothetical protein
MSETKNPVDPLRGELLAALRATDAQHPLRVAFGKLLAENVTLMTGVVAGAGQSSEDRHFNAGRLADALDLRELWADCGVEAAKGD